MITIVSKSGNISASWSAIKAEISLRKSKYKKDVVVGFCDVVSLDQIIEYLSCFEAGGIPVFLSHPSVKTNDKLFQERLNNWKALGISTFKSSFIDEENLNQPIDNPDGINFIQLSSGTTSSQKGFGFKRQTLQNQIEAYSKHLNLNASSTIVSWLPVYHDMGLITSIFIPYFTECNVAIIPTFEWLMDQGSLIDIINEFKGDFCWLPNFCFEILAKLDKKIEHQFCLFINCSEVCRHSSVSRFLSKFPNCHIDSCYAMAENVFAVAQSAFVGDTLGDVLSCGSEISGTSIDLNDQGEILISGDCLFDATFKEGKLIKRTEKWYNTGDIGRRVYDNLFVVGRTKEMIKVYGKQIFLPDIDKEINSNLSVHAGRVVSFGVDEKGTQTLIVLYEADLNLDIDIRRLVSEKFDITSTVMRMKPQTLNKTSSGKLSRDANKAIYHYWQTLFEILSRQCKTPISSWDIELKTLGLLDSFSVMEVLTELSSKLKQPINWQYDFKLLNTPSSFLEALI